jgi:SAM-dependent methyltransferase
MDDPGLDPGEHRRALAGLARINTVSGAGASLWRAVRALLVEGEHADHTERARHAEHGDGRDGGEGESGIGSGGGVGAVRRMEGSIAVRPVRVLDVATGSGDVLLAMHRRAHRAGVAIEATAGDISCVALQAAEARFAGAGIPLRTVTLDAHAPFPLADGAFDVACSSLFLHHLDRAQAVHVVAEMARVAARGVALLDLRRCGAGLLAAHSVPRLLTRSPVVHVDAVRSARGALSEHELLEIAAAAGLRAPRVRRVFPWRMVLLARRSAGTP